jgi:hypothetical protein
MRGVVLKADLVSDYLRVADHRITGRMGEFDASFFPKAIWAPDTITSVAIVGRIAP